jgi:hypothetical protein
MKREEGRSQASADALASYMLFVDDLSIAQSLVHQCRRDLNAAIKSLHHAQMAEQLALQAYESVPWADAS